MASSYAPPFEIHVHGEVPLRPDVSYAQLQDALKPLWSYAGASSLAKGAVSSYEEEPGIRVNDKEHLLSMCWTVSADEAFRSSLEEMCMNLNELSSAGAAIEISIYDTEYDEEDEDETKESRDDFLMLFVGPTPGDIMQVQRDMLIEDVTAVMERHFEKEEMGDVVAEIDKMFSKRFDAMVNSLTIPRSLRGGPGAAGGLGGHGGGGGRKPRHLH
ncbi:DUF6806 family protein [Variovorax sp. PCZ-1]|uniref:DUF6806 family protein n=1 Tax=Variovorax sp. PCZ-1 TaxID=2835533 RepID=UPI001BCB2A2C|nr:DUF6806 family protein [Variovorax sp. PCZ-1]MBS7806988.1 hypothetical protein [Variovorax sp. PCZ-1]